MYFWRLDLSSFPGSISAIVFIQHHPCYNNNHSCYCTHTASGRHTLH